VHRRAPEVHIPLTQGGRLSTNDKILQALADTDLAVRLVQEAREIRKLRGVYVQSIPRLLHRDGRLHPRYRITRTATGRLSAADPNVLAFPKHSTRGALVRQGFIAGPGRELGEWDLKQIEMCQFAHDANDRAMIAEICSGVDKHYATASRALHKPIADVSKEERFAAKAINFGILMGITPSGLLAQLHKQGQLSWTLDACAALLAEWLAAYPEARDYIQRKHAEARRYGYVRDMWGRLRWVAGVWSVDDRIREEALRQAQATPTQSGAQGIMKRAMAAAWPALVALRRSGVWVEPLLQIHDALVVEYDTAVRDEVNAIITAAMTQTVTLRVPILVDCHTGQRLGDL
jgi:DNA polymerase-1